MDTATIKQTAIEALRRPISTMDDSVEIESILHGLANEAGGALLAALYDAEDTVSMVAPDFPADGSPLISIEEWRQKAPALERGILSA